MAFEKLKERFPKIRENEPLKNHCTFRVGGPADFFYELTNIEELPTLVIFAEENGLTYRIIGRGTNVLFTDKGFRGLIIKNLTNQMKVEGDQIIADSGVLLSQIIRLGVDNNLRGLEPLYGLPGTIGAAVWGNAGVPGTEVGSFVISATLFNPSDGVREAPASEIIFRYRFTSLQQSHDYVLRATLELKKGSGKESKELMKQIDSIRRGKQPVGYSAGSFFKNPSPRPSLSEAKQILPAYRPGRRPQDASDQAAGYLIDKVGLKGMHLGDAEISPKHGNFFMNRGQATAAQILELAELAKAKVKKEFGVELEMEVKIIGDL